MTKKHGSTIVEVARGHAPRITQDIDGVWTRIVGCTCGWRTPPRTTDSDDALAVHVAIARAAEGSS